MRLQWWVPDPAARAPYPCVIWLPRVRKRLCHDLLLIFVDNVAHSLGADYFNRITVFLQQTDEFIRTPDSF